MLQLVITYSETYPDELPEIAIEAEEGELSEEEEETLVVGLIGAVSPSPRLLHRSMLTLRYVGERFDRNGGLKLSLRNCKICSLIFRFTGYGLHVIAVSQRVASGIAD